MADYLSGLLTAWAAAQLGLSVFFILAYFLGRRELEYFIFSLLCLSLSVGSIGVAGEYSALALPTRIFAEQVTHGGMIFAAALNLHFALCFARVVNLQRRVIWLYVVALGYLVVLLSGSWWRPGPPEVEDAFLFGKKIAHLAGEATWVGKSFYVVASVETALAAAVLLAVFFTAGAAMLPVALAATCERALP